jgi:hypothetical protein
MPWGTISLDQRFKDFLLEAQREPSRREHHCAVECGVKIRVGDDMQFVRLSEAEWTVVHRSCWDALPDRPHGAVDTHVREVYATGQRERANGVVDFLRRGEQPAWAVLLPEQDRRRGRRFVVYVDGDEGSLQIAQDGHEH